MKVTVLRALVRELRDLELVLDAITAQPRQPAWTAALQAIARRRDEIEQQLAALLDDDPTVLLPDAACLPASDRVH